MSNNLLEVQSLSRKFGALQAVDQLSFFMEKGQIYGFIGPNGAGKTTTMRMLATLDIPDSGDAQIRGESILVSPRKVRMQVGFMSDQFQPYPNLDVMEYLDFFARAYGLRGRTRIRTVQSVSSFCGLTDFADRPVTGLSKGMGQRLHLAKTLLHDPSLLILDEPASGLDPHARIDFRELIKELAAAGKGILISSHILSELGEVCHGVIVIERGKRVLAGNIQEIAKEMTGTRPVRVRVLNPIEEAERFFLTQPQVRELKVNAPWVHFQFDGDETALSELLTRAVGAGLKPIEFHQVEADLEDIFLKTTKGRLQ